MKQFKYKNAVSVLLAVTLFTSVSLAPKKSNAALATFGGGAVVIPFVIIGASTGVGTTGAILSIKYFHNTLLKIVGAGGSIAVAVAGIFLGLVILDDHGPSSIPLQYAPLTADQSALLGVTPEQVTQYESDLPQINAIAQQISYDVVQNETTSDTAGTLQYVQGEWANYGAMISPDSLVVVQKIGDYAVAQGSAQ